MQIDSISGPLVLTGSWRVTHRIETSERPDFVGLEIVFQIALEQDGDQLAGEGEKFLVDRHPAEAGAGSRLEITGWVQQNDVSLALMEIGPARTNIGQIDWKAVSPDYMVGSFRVDLAGTDGRSEAVRSESS